MTREELIRQIRLKKSFLCVGLDTDIRKIPEFLMNEPDPVLAFNKAIIDATAEYAVAYKINTAFYESMGAQGWSTMQETLSLIPSDIFTIADAKRGDIGNTSHMYARAFFEAMNFDSVTLAPYMGRDSVSPFFEYPGKWGIVLALTSNPGSADFEQLQVGDKKLYEQVIETLSGFTTPDNLMFVVGATKAEELAKIRQRIPKHFLLVPGVGAQGGSLPEVAHYGMNKDCGLLVNASRSIIYAGDSHDFAEKAYAESRSIASEMSILLKQHEIV